MGLIFFFRLPPDPPAPSQRPAVYRFFGLGGGVPFDDDRTVSSPYIRPLHLGVVRLLLGFYGFTAFFVYFCILISQSNKFLRKQAWKLIGDIMFHSYLGMTSYFLFAGCHSLLFARESRNPLSTWPRTMQLAHILLQTTALTFPLFCTIIYLYWILPSLPGWYTRSLTQWSTITFYMLNTLFSLVELVLSASTPRPWSHLIVIILLLGLYLAFHSILVAASGGKIWIYTVLKYSLPINHGWISAVRAIGLCVLGGISFCIMQLLLWIKCQYLGGLKFYGIVQDNITTQRGGIKEGGDRSQGAIA